MRLFVDTGALAALHVASDQRHAAALEFFGSLSPGTRLQTSNLVFAETLNLIAARVGQDGAIRVGEAFLASRLMEIVHYVDEPLERAALAVMRRFRDKPLSFVDASSIALVKSEGLDGVFGFDRDFARCGVPLFPRG